MKTNLSIHKVCPINLEWNNYNGFEFSLLRFEIYGKKRCFDGELLGLSFSKDHFTYSLLFFDFDVKKPIFK